MNFKSQPLTKNESEKFKKSDEIKARVVKSYELILDFFGLKLLNEKTGEIGRNKETYEQRYAFLSRSSHNYLRITRILKFFAIIEFEEFQMNFMEFMIEEIFKNNLLQPLMESLVSYWLPTILRESSLQKLESKIMELLQFSKISRKFYRHDAPCWANTRILDVEIMDYSTISKPLMEFPVLQSNYSKPYENLTTTSTRENKIFVKESTPLEDEDGEMGSLFD
jgi:hypothetical protein